MLNSESQYFKMIKMHQLSYLQYKHSKFDTVPHISVIKQFTTKKNHEKKILKMQPLEYDQ